MNAYVLYLLSSGKLLPMAICSTPEDAQAEAGIGQPVKWCPAERSTDEDASLVMVGLPYDGNWELGSLFTWAIFEEEPDALVMEQLHAFAWLSELLAQVAVGERVRPRAWMSWNVVTLIFTGMTLGLLVYSLIRVLS